MYVCTYVAVGETSNHQNTPGDDISSQGGLSVSLSLDPPKYVLVGGWVESGGRIKDMDLIIFVIL